MDLATERTRLLERDVEWAAIASKGRDVERILSYWTDDAVVVPPGFPAIVGKDALRQYVEGSLRIPGFRITWTPMDVTFSRDGNLAYIFDRNDVEARRPTVVEAVADYVVTRARHWTLSAPRPRSPAPEAGSSDSSSADRWSPLVAAGTIGLIETRGQISTAWRSCRT